MMCFGEWNSTWSFLSNFLLPTLLFFKLLMTPKEGMLNIEHVSTDT